MITEFTIGLQIKHNSYINKPVILFRCLNLLYNIRKRNQTQFQPAS